MRYIGIDGCKGGWFYIGLDDDGVWSLGILPEISQVSQFISQSQLILIDIPIGLRTSENEQRLCDIEARAILKKRRSSVFPAPSRFALDGPDYKESSQINEIQTGRKLSRQSWGITDKIKQVDIFLHNYPTDRKVREFHPEVAFWALNNRLAMQNYKKTDQGYFERLALLSKFYRQIGNAVTDAQRSYSRSELARDDLLDAMVGAVTARFYLSLGTLPAIPEIDSTGLAMEIVYTNLQGRIYTPD